MFFFVENVGIFPPCVPRDQAPPLAIYPDSPLRRCFPLPRIKPLLSPLAAISRFSNAGSTITLQQRRSRLRPISVIPTQACSVRLKHYGPISSISSVATSQLNPDIDPNLKHKIALWKIKFRSRFPCMIAILQTSDEWMYPLTPNLEQPNVKVLGYIQNFHVGPVFFPVGFIRLFLRLPCRCPSPSFWPVWLNPG